MRVFAILALIIFIPSFSLANITIFTNNINQEWIYTVRNTFPCPAQILLTYTNKQGKEEIIHHVIAAYSEQIVFSISNKTTPSFRFRYELGDPFVQPEDVEYWLPVPPGQVVRITQGYNSRFSHKGKNAYSIDFALSIGTPVYAARGGVVVMVKKDSRVGGNRKAYRGRANYIIIYHNDGTFAHYVHLKHNGVVVKPGDKVVAGQLIGYSGNTGWTKGPHLHFMVTKAYYMDRSSIPTRFYSSSGSLTNLVARQFYLVEHPTMTIASSYLTNTNSIALDAIGEDEDEVGAP